MNPLFNKLHAALLIVETCIQERREHNGNSEDGEDGDMCRNKKTDGKKRRQRGSRGGVRGEIHMLGEQGSPGPAEAASPVTL